MINFHQRKTVDRWSYAAIKIVLAFGLFSGLAQQVTLAEQNQDPDKRATNQNASQAAEATGPTNPTSTPTPALENKNSNGDNNAPKLTDWLEAGISAALLLVIIIQSIIYHQQRQVMERQLSAMQESLKETRKIVHQNEGALIAAEKQAHASEIAAQAAKDSAGMAKEAFETIERAHIIINQMESQGFGLGVEPPAVIIEFFNAGRTAASQLVSFVKLVAEPEPPANPPLEEASIVRKVSIGVLPSHGKQRVLHPQTDFKLTEEQHVALHNGELHLFAIGQVRYSDVRGDVHALDFCGVHNWRLGQFDLYYPAPIIDAS